MLTSEFDFVLPRELIAQTPAPERSASRLMVLDRGRRSIEHSQFSQVGTFLRPGDVLVVNDTKVLAARLQARTGKERQKKVEILLLEKIGDCRWTCLAGPGRNAKPGERIVFSDPAFAANVIDKTDFGGRVLEFDAGVDVDKLMKLHGAMPLPPYIAAEGRQAERDLERYQTVFAKNPGAVAAPTAALHFTEELLEQLSKSGVEIRKVTLHVGLGTFRPVKTEQVEDHVMHEEKFMISAETASAILHAREKKRRIVAVGTTSVRALESFFGERPLEPDRWHATKMFILPGYGFGAVDALITNFHLPHSTLLMLVSAFAGKEFLFQAYAEAIRNRYRFYSYGDAMFII